MAKRDYDNNYPSVTTILGVLRKIALEWWFKVNTLEYINRESNKGKQIGTDIHNAIEHYVLTGEAKIETEYPEEVTTALKSFIEFKKSRPDIKLQWAETKLISEKYKFNGTIDCIGLIGNDLIILDWKTGQAKEKEFPDIYDEYKYQVSAYVHLYNENYPDKKINTAIIVSIAKDKISYNSYCMNESEIRNCFEEVFLPALKILTYQKRKGK